MKWFRLSNDFIINVEQITTITKPVKKDPYNKNYGKEYEIVMSSGCRHLCFDSISTDTRITVNLFGASVLKYDDLLRILDGALVENLKVSE